MKKEDRELLLQNLCGRLPYDVKIELTNNGGYHHENIAKKGDKTIDTLKGFTGKYFTIHHDNPLDWDWADNEIEVEDIKPYLFPMSSMTEEQYNQYVKYSAYESIDWLNKNHFDYRGLIDKGLALDATDKNIY